MRVLGRWDSETLARGALPKEPLGGRTGKMNPWEEGVTNSILALPLDHRLSLPGPPIQRLSLPVPPTKDSICQSYQPRVDLVTPTSQGFILPVILPKDSFCHSYPTKDSACQAHPAEGGFCHSYIPRIHFASHTAQGPILLPRP